MTQPTPEAAQPLKVGQEVWVRAEVLEIVEPNNRGIGIKIFPTKSGKFELPLWADAAALAVSPLEAQKVTREILLETNTGLGFPLHTEPTEDERDTWQIFANALNQRLAQAKPERRPPRESELRALIAQWRDMEQWRRENFDVDKMGTVVTDRLKLCADELEALLAAPSAGEQIQVTPTTSDIALAHSAFQKGGVAMTSNEKTQRSPYPLDKQESGEHGADKYINECCPTCGQPAGEQAAGQREEQPIFDLDLFRAMLIDGQIIKESDGEPWPLTKSEADQICAYLQERLTAVGLKVWPVRALRGAGQ